ncbi:uncharacterized protein L201_001513 [Kwoniella dendrophila CBS 6074]|uniref:F-box domain-containing protein n=1 Tax=Kwoniella dendrophila CBS 6074 TaxID=1295534 RepID=A0AAX4JMI6_9TREE
MTVIMSTTSKTTSAGNNACVHKSSLDLQRFPSDIVHLLFLALDNLPQSSLHNLIRCSWEFHDRFAPILYEKLFVHKGNVKSVLFGLDQEQSKSKFAEAIKRTPEHRSKTQLLGYAKHLTIVDLPSAEYVSRALITHSSKSNHSPINSYFPNLKTLLFSSLVTLELTPKAILGLADIYNASSWGSSPFNIPSQPILRALRYNIKPKTLVLNYPSSGSGIIRIHIHSCIEEVISYLSLGWELDELHWKGLNRSLIGPVPRSKKLIHSFEKCHLPLPSPNTDRNYFSGKFGKDDDIKSGCGYHYDHISLTCSTFIEHLLSLPFSSIEEREESISLELRGLKCLFTLEWNKLVDEIWSRLGRLDDEDWVKIDQWYRAKVTLTAKE